MMDRNIATAGAVVFAVVLTAILVNTGMTVRPRSPNAAGGKARATRPRPSPASSPVRAARTLPSGSWQPSDSPFGVVLEAETCDDPRLPQILRSATEHGFRIVRTTISWREVEAKPGTIRFERYDRLVRAARPLGLDLMFTLSFCPDWASSLKAEPADVRARSMPADLKTWSRFVAATVAHFRDSVRYWQIWETPSIGHFRGTVKDYMDLLAAAHRAARDADPHSLVFATEPGGPDLGFIVRLCQRPMVDSFEGICLTPRVEAPERAVPYFQAIKHHILSAPGVRTKLLFVADWGRSVTERGAVRSSEDDEALAHARGQRAQREQASFAVRAYSVALSNGVERVFWNRLVETAQPDPVHDSYQLLDRQLRPLPAAVALRKLFAFLPNQASYDLYGIGSTSARLIAFKAPEERALLWCAYSSTRLTPPDVPGLEGNETTRVIAALEGDPNGLRWERQQSLQLRTEPLLLSGFRLAPARLQKQNSWFPPPPARDAVTLDFGEEPESGGISWRKYRLWNLGSPPLIEQGRERVARLIPEGAELSPFIYGDIDDGFLFFNRTHRVEVTVRARCEDPSRKAGFNLVYDSPRGQVFSEWTWVEGNRGWKSFTVTLPDPYFANSGGYDFRLSALGSSQELLVSRITVRRAGAR